MCKFKTIGLIALIVLTFGMTAIGNAMASEKYKSSGVMYAVKWQPINVGDEEGHLVVAKEFYSDWEVEVELP